MDAFTYSPTRGVRGWLVAAILASALLIPAVAARAATVTTTEDGGPGSLRQALADAQPGETIVLPAGEYALTKGQLNVTQTVTIAGAGAAGTEISGNKASRIFSVTTSGVSLTVSGITLSRGIARSGFAEGAAIRQENNGDLTLRNDVLTANSAGVPGGTVFGGTVAFFGGKMTIADTQIVGNRATTDASADQHFAGDVIGGAVFAFGEGLVVERSSIEGNRASSRGDGDTSFFEEEGAILGAGMLLESSGLIRVLHSTVSGNLADSSNQAGGGEGRGKAGGLAIFTEGGKARLDGVTISGNEVRTGSEGAAEGGGLMVFKFGESLVEVTGSTIASNSIEGIPSEVLAEEGFLSQGGNVVARGEGALSFANTIIASGAGPEGSENCGAAGEESTAASILSLGFNLDTAGDCGLKSDGDVIGQDPLLGPLQDNGGPTKTMLPGVGSPAIDQGSAFGENTDQRGLGRPLDLPGVPNSTVDGADGSDIGAVEVQASE